MTPYFLPSIAAVNWGLIVPIVLGLTALGLVYWFMQTQQLTEAILQRFVHQLEEGGWVRLVQVIVILSAIGFMTYLWFFKEFTGFKGLANEKAIEQAQIAREIDRGNGFTTKMIRPAAIALFERRTGSFPIDHIPDIYHAPLPPFLNAAVFKVMDKANAGLKALSHGQGILSRATYDEVMNSKLIIYSYDRIIAFTQFLCFLLAVVVNYFIARRLFDDRLATISVGLMLLCEKFWDFAMSGLPQMFLLLLFSGAIYFLIRAIEARNAERSALPWLIGAAAMFGLLALGHGITIWIFGGALIFCAIYFRPRCRDAAIMLAVFLVFYSPWLYRNYRVCGSPGGLGWYTCLYMVRGSENRVMRSDELPLTGVSPEIFRQKIQGETVRQISGLVGYLGQSLVPLMFFIALLHLFRRPEVANFRWCVLSMWFSAVFGMAFFGMPDIDTSQVQSNDMHMLFIPVMTFYGLAFILVLWSRLDIRNRFLRYASVWLLFIVSSVPFINQVLAMLGPRQNAVQWPPYVPPSIAQLNQWTRDEEIISSDMPWAVAWYADRKSLWIPQTLRTFLQLNDEDQLKGRIVGLYLTPVSGNRSFVAEIVKGDYKDWAPFITRQVNTREFPLKAVTPMAIDGECIYYSDRDRWTNREE